MTKINQSQWTFPLPTVIYTQIPFTNTDAQAHTVKKENRIKSKWWHWAVISNIWIWHHGSFMKDLGLITYQYRFLCYSYPQLWMQITRGFQCFFFKDVWTNVWISLLSWWSFAINSWDRELTITSAGKNMFVSWWSIIVTLNKRLP